MSKKKLKMTVLVDIAAVPEDDPQFFVENSSTTEHHVIQTIRQLGHEVKITAVGDDIIDIASRIKQQAPDLIFNLTEEFKGDRRQDKNIAAVLELLNARFTGAGSNGLMLCRDKSLCKQILAHHRIRVPNFMFFPRGRAIKFNKSFSFPLVVKPAFEDGSEGISNASVVNDLDSLRQRIEFVTEKWNQGAIAEEYIGGREFYVGVIGNKRLITLPLRECSFNNEDSDGPLLATYRVKWDEQYRNKWNIKYGSAELDEVTTKRINKICKRAYKYLQMRDYARIDLRVTDDNKIVILEVNPNPDIAYGEEVAEAANQIGISYDQLIAKIISSALSRYK